MKTLAVEKVLLIFLVFVLINGCETTNDPKHNPPQDHTISKEGYMHKSGLEQPMLNCTNCHGSDLKGGSVSVSCFECHGTKW